MGDLLTATFPTCLRTWNTCAVCVPSHASLRLHLSQCNYRGNRLQGRIHRPTVVCAKPSVCWAFSRQASWALTDHQVFQFCPSTSTRQISGYLAVAELNVTQQQNSKRQGSSQTSVKNQTRVGNLPDALEVEQGLRIEVCSLGTYIYVQRDAYPPNCC